MSTFSIGGTYILINKATNSVADFSQSTKKTLIGYKQHDGINQQWIVEDAGSGLYYIRSGMGVYVTFEGKPQAKTPILCTNNKQAWRIVRDKTDQNAVNVMHPTENFSLDLTGSDPANDVPVILYPTHTDPAARNQAWQLRQWAEPIVRVSAIYNITNRATATVADFSQSTKRTLVGYQPNGQDNQQWTFESAGAGLWFIRSQKGGGYVNWDGEPQASRPLLVTDRKQPWRVVRDRFDANFVNFVHPTLGFSMDLTGSSSANDTPIILYPTHTDPASRNQQWGLKVVADALFDIGRTYIFTNKATGTVADFSQSTHRTLIGYKLHGGANQQWTIQSTGDGLYNVASINYNVFITYEGEPQASTPLLCTQNRQAWRIRRDNVDRNLLTLLHPTKDLSFDITGSNPANDTPVILYPTHTDPKARNQAWGFKLV